MKAPAFWGIKSGRDAAIMTRSLLLPFSFLYNYFTQRKLNKISPLKLNVPVISIGNISLGGTGKTPLAKFFQNAFLEKYNKPFVVSRGYGAKIKDAHIVSLNDNPQDVGDEPFMLAKTGNVCIGRDRVEAANLAIKNGANLIILDDAHQNPAIKKDLSIVVIDGGVGFGNRYVFPSGPLREKVQTGLKRADLIIWIGNKELFEEELEGFDIPVVFAKIVPANHCFKGKYVGFCGIGRPQKFEDTLKESNVDIVDFIPFSDHHFFSENELKNLSDIAKSHDAKLITTEKDFVRIAKNQQSDIEYLPISIEFENIDTLYNVLKYKALL